MPKEVKNAMLAFIEFFKKYGIAKYEGENILVAAEQLLGVCKRLDAVGALTKEHVHDLDRLEHCQQQQVQEHVQVNDQAVGFGKPASACHHQ